MVNERKLEFLTVYILFYFFMFYQKNRNISILSKYQILLHYLLYIQ